ncbi:MAG: hypothetical protein K9N06_09640 [Candidatus Cloacimonetes bacterium]|nr:hypothetical protein [Candidatus Cloacimonadota bacterium]
MKLKEILALATDKTNFNSINAYSDYCMHYLEFIQSNLQAVIVSRNENHYRFFQYKEEGSFNVTRPINSNLMLTLESFDNQRNQFFSIIRNIKDKSSKTKANRKLINDFVYTCQQSIGATLDALPAKQSNTARKINGHLFERFIRLIISEIGIDVKEGIISVPVIIKGEEIMKMRYQHDLIIEVDEVTKAIGSVKTSSKDRLDKIFIDKFLYNRLTDTKTPHFAIFLNDVLRKGKESSYSIGSTFLPGHFKGYTIKLNPLDGVYYLDIRPNMRTEDILKDQIKTFDNFLIKDVWRFIK